MINFFPVRKPFFSEDPKRETSWIMFFLGVAFVSAAILILAWQYYLELLSV